MVRAALATMPPRAWFMRWVFAPFVAAGLLWSVADRSSIPVIGTAQLSAVVLLDGQAYFGRLRDVPWSDTLLLRDAYYLQDARDLTTDTPVALVRRGTEVHKPAQAMSIRRDKVLLVERISPTAPVALAILADRTLRGPE